MNFPQEMDPPAEASIDWSPELLAKKLSILSGQKLSEAELQSYAQAWYDLPDDDPRRERLGLALWGAHEAYEERDFSLSARHEFEFWTELFKLKQ